MTKPIKRVPPKRVAPIVPTTQHRFEAGDVVVVNPNVSDLAGTVVAVFGDLIVFQEADGNFDAWNAAEMRLVAKAASPHRVAVDSSASAKPPTHDMRVGDVVAIEDDQTGGGEVIAVVEDAIVCRRVSGGVEAYDDPDKFILLSRRAAGPQTSELPLRADQFDDGTCIDKNGKTIRIGDRVENEAYAAGGHVVAIAGDQLIFINDWDGGDVSIGAFRSQSSRDGFLRHSRPAGTIVEHVALVKADAKGGA